MAAEDNTPELESLIAQVALRDRQAFQQLYKYTAARLLGILMRLLRERSLAEDALQETFVQVWRNAGSYRAAAGKPMTWLGSIARYRAIDILRQRKQDTHSSPILPGQDNNEDELQYLQHFPEHDQGRLGHCLKALEELHRKAILMCYCEGYSHQELSLALTSPLGTVKSWIRRGIRSLKECMES